MIGNHLEHKRVGLVVLSPYPQDPRPRRTAKAFVQQGMIVDYICVTDTKDPWHEKVDGIDVFRVPIAHRRGGKLAYAYEYCSFIMAAATILSARSLRHPYDLIYVNNMPDILVVSALVPKIMGAKVILDLHDPMPELLCTIFGVDPGSTSVRMMKWLEKWSMARADLVLTVNLACQRIIAMRSCPLEKTGVVMNSPDESIFPFRAAHTRPVRSRDRNQPFVVMYHGSLVERNGLDLAVEAIARVRNRIPRAQLHIYGKTTEFSKRVMKSACERGLGENVHHLGQRSLEEIAHAIEGCDLGIIPNHISAFSDINTPTRIFEYLALGKPVIAPRTAGIVDYFRDGSLLLFKAGNVEDLADNIAFAACDPTEVLNITERGQQVYAAHSWCQERQTLITLVSKLFQNEISHRWVRQLSSSTVTAANKTSDSPE